MFDTVFAGRDEASLIAAIEQAACEEAQAGARKLAAIAELAHASVTYDQEHDQWVYDSWAATASEVGAVLNVGQRRASGQMRMAVALRDRLPKVGALYLQGRLSGRLVSEITWRTRLVEDAQVLALLDAALADKALRWGPLPEARLTRTIDALLTRYDPDAVIRAEEAVKKRDFRVGSCDDPDELVSVYGHVLGCDAAVLSARIAVMLKGICDNDPRTIGERRSCAVGAIIQGHDQLPCRCGSPECAASPPPKSNVVITVIADPAAIEAAQTLIADQDRAQQEKRAPAPEPRPDRSPCPQDSGVALLPGVTILPIVALAEAIRNGAAIKELWLPGPDPEPHYRPSAKLAAFVRARDMFCRFPGCDVPAERCDIDHVVPWPYGPTHPSNLNCKCRTHHLAKTFWDGWRDEQSPDGTVTWTTPAGQRYTTAPGSRLLFPTWNTATAELAPLAQPPPESDRSLKMPKRRRTRATENAARIKAERAHNAAARPIVDHGNDPPPF
ncbi:HNH endonuclease signature motif containing protein [Mycolicibacterium litorale]|nr:HNH endonuclease signature motif containing protein [Mycolicibacterium litorale]